MNASTSELATGAATVRTKRQRRSTEGVFEVEMLVEPHTAESRAAMERFWNLFTQRVILGHQGHSD